VAAGRSRIGYNDAMTRSELVAKLAAVSHASWMRQKVRDQGANRDDLVAEVQPHDVERAEDAVAELERLGVLRLD
jgi:hypothetical protein